MELEASKFVANAIAKNTVLVFSKTFCPYCKIAKDCLSQVGAKFHVIEIEDRADCSAIQNALLELTGARTVPRVFIAGKFVGGGTEIKALKDQGKLIPILQDAKGLLL